MVSTPYLFPMVSVTSRTASEKSWFHQLSEQIEALLCFNWKNCNILSKGKKCGFTYSFGIYECRKITFFHRLMPACSCPPLLSCRWQISYNQAFISICVFVLMHIIHEKHAFEEPFSQNAINLSEFVTVRKRPRTQKSPHDEGKLLNGTHEHHWNEGNTANASAQQRRQLSQAVSSVTKTTAHI